MYVWSKVHGFFFVTQFQSAKIFNCAPKNLIQKLPRITKTLLHNVNAAVPGYYFLGIEGLSSIL